MDAVLAVDIGTSATKAVIVDRDGRVVLSVRRAYPMLTPRPGWAEQDPDAVFGAVVAALRAAYASRPEDTRIAAVSFSGQLYSIVPLDGHGMPLANCLTWADRRSAVIADHIRLAAGSRSLSQTTGCPIDATYGPARIAWLEEHGPGESAARYATIKEYVLHRLFGTFVVDWSIASATGLLDIRTAGWDDAALSAAGIGRDRLSPPVSPRTILTRWLPEALAATGIPQGTPCVIGAGDGPLASVAMGAFGRGIAAANVGASAAARCLVTAPTVDPDGRLWTYLLDEGWWVVGGHVSSGSIVFDWAGRVLGTADAAPADGGDRPAGDAATLDELAARVAPGAEGLIFLPYLSGEQSPTWDARTSGGFLGLTLRHEREHVARAVLEGITMSIQRVVEALAATVVPIGEVRVAGGLSRSATWRRIAADMFGARIVVPASAEGSSLGAAVMAWVALGVLPNLVAAEGLVRTTETVEPDPVVHERYREYLRRADDLLRAVKTVARVS